MSWDVSSDGGQYADGVMGFTIIDKDGITLAERAPFLVSSAGHLDFRGEIHKISFNTNSNDGGNLAIKLVKNGVDQRLMCTNCLVGSQILKLQRLMIDGNMGSTPGTVPGAWCGNQCEFTSGR